MISGEYESGIGNGSDSSQIFIRPDVQVVNGPSIGRLESANGILLRSDEHIVIFDPGLRFPDRNGLLDQIADVTPTTQIAILVTHIHSDHTDRINSISEEVEKSGGKVTVFASQLTKDRVERGDPQESMAGFYKRRFSPFTIDHVLHDRQELEFGNDMGVRVIATPGHSPDHHSFSVVFHGYTILFAGDALGGAVDARLGSDLEQYRDSIWRLGDEHPDIIIRGHGLADKFPSERNEKLFSVTAQTRGDLRPGDNGLIDSVCGTF
jgi:glyoxylase-like metal-dependent hydrolase (beta-lactamase superfamily II)